MSSNAEYTIAFLGIANMLVSLMTIFFGLYYRIPHYFGWIAEVVIIIELALGIILVTASTNKGFAAYASFVTKRRISWNFYADYILPDYCQVVIKAGMFRS